jgi:lambda family phage minor tail protein L
MDSDSAKERITDEIFKLESDAVVEMFEIDFSNLQNDFSFLDKKYKINLGSEPVYRFCSSVNLTNPLIWQGKEYPPLPIHTSDFEIPSDGRLPRPKLTIANPSGLLSTIVLMNYDFHGCKVTRKRTFAKFLDDANFRSRSGAKKNPSKQADPQAFLPDEVFYINKKIAETRESLEFELTSILEMEGVRFPAREMLADHCSFRYRGLGCSYCGIPCETETGKSFAEYGISAYTNPNVVLDLGTAQERNAPIELNEEFGRDVMESIKWSVDRSYRKGNVVNWPGHKEPLVPSLFVCVQSHEEPSPNPYVSKEFWIMDSCQKTLSSCLRRWGAEVRKGRGVPFGGFPETDGMKHA